MIFNRLLILCCLLLFSQKLISSNLLADTIFKIPVVIHIIHNNGSENIDDNQVIQGIAFLNDALANCNQYFSVSGHSCKIELCLSAQDEKGKPTNGIIRHLSKFTEMDLENSLDSLAEISSWESKKYLNIRLVKKVCSTSACNLGGIAYLPNAHGLKKDGIYLNAQSFGLNVLSTKIAVHELGHYLGLFHIFQKGCKNDNCLVDGDKVCDTPPQLSTIEMCLNGMINSCSTDEDDLDIINPFRSISLGGKGDQYDEKRNFMDYGELKCKDHFTLGQIYRMRSTLTTERSSLLTSTSCDHSCLSPSKAYFEANKNIFNAGDTIKVKNLSTNASSFLWYLNNKSIQMVLFCLLDLM
jgi:hypothetical protein